MGVLWIANGPMLLQLLSEDCADVQIYLCFNYESCLYLICKDISLIILVIRKALSN